MSSLPHAGDTFPSISRLRAAVSELLPHAVMATGGALPLELKEGVDEAPRMFPCTLLEAFADMRRAVGEPEAAFRAFLDGKQRSEMLAFVGGVPITVGTVGAVVRERTESRANTWKVRQERRLYAPLALLQDLLAGTSRTSLGIVDTTDSGPGGDEPVARHPAQLTRRAYHMIQNDRERLERELADEWCAERQEMLLVDGSISRIGAARSTGNLVGLIKSHRTMYQHEDHLDTIFALEYGERSAALLIEQYGTQNLATWYLRVRGERAMGPLWGLVRIEIPEDQFATERADAISRWVLAEGVPLSLPDARWDRLVYGVRDCEAFLSAVL